ncbi:MAG: bifunctional indole-3-glycerol-phosphate synthase TrpC/phosphoribosylanthranilate isomerase TrpF [Corynebacterium sp.]|nr:bifunctional indole-3-glycerol-phosphate synthase TrpC/phosphoribosylanthranilate isomerase TrpF [Corynebacterium sp.]
MPCNHQLPTVLEDIVRARRGHLADIAQRIAHVDVEALPRSTRSLYDNLNGARNAFIMECKSSSPSLGLIREHYEPGAIARVYSRYAAGISVLCEPERFGGDYDHLATVAMSTHVPVLCKDFIIDEVQIHAARYFGADAILLMLSVLDDSTYTRLQAEARRFGLDVLTEVIDADEIERALRLGANIFGINHRNLHDLTIDLSRSGELAALLPEGSVVVAESGIRDNATVRALGGHSNAFLAGSQLTSTPDIDRAARELVFGHNKVCGLNSWSVAQAARAAGAVYGGLVFAESSPRNVSRETAIDIIAHEPDLDYVAVSRRITGWAELAAIPGIKAVQIHAPYQGSVDAELALIAAVRGELADASLTDCAVWRAVSMTQSDGPAVASALVESGSVDMIVLDAADGGSGTSFDWSTVPNNVRAHALLAGGLSPENVTAALAVGCYGVDINSGVETAPGHKDTGLIARTFAQVRSFAHER